MVLSVGMKKKTTVKVAKKRSRAKEKTKKQKTAGGAKMAVQKVTVGEDEFCPTCMEWRAFDELTGKCVVCGHLIRKSGPKTRTVRDEYDLKDFTVEHDESSETSEF
ncbi:MAG: hypothetical protein JXA00_06795 [Candidatus Thermoplasmatota archaeon]|nr:hypothetical protein [Candidatus Thermoplasmatota archaeon]